MQKNKGNQFSDYHFCIQPTLFIKNRCTYSYSVPLFESRHKHPQKNTLNASTFTKIMDGIKQEKQQLLHKLRKYMKENRNVTV